MSQFCASTEIPIATDYKFTNVLRCARLPFAALLIFLLSGCTVIPAIEATARQTTPLLQAQLRPASTVVPSSPSVALAPDLASASTNRLLVVGVDGNLFTIAPTGGERFYLTDDATPQQLYTQPTWSSTGERIAWTSITRASGAPQGQLITTLANGTERTKTATLFPPFYLFWSPDDRRVAYLSNWLDNQRPTIALHVANVPPVEGAVEENAVELIGVGQPFYFSWAPTGDKLIAHVGNQQVLLLDVTQPSVKAQSTVLVEASANFAAPQWFSMAQDFSMSGAAETTETDEALFAAGEGGLLYVILDDNTAQLVLSDEDGTNERLLTPLARQDFLSFNMNATGSHIAFIETTDRVGFNSFGPLFLYDLTDEVFQQISTDPTLAFFWSPDGSTLYFLTVEIEGGSSWLRVNIWDGNSVRQFARFVPSPTFARDYLPFADQYMQSMRFWSPDSQAVVYTGQADDGTAGVWVQPVQEGKNAIFVAAGTFATWSPR